MSDNILSRIANTLPIRWGYFKKSGQPQKVIFVGHEKAIYGADGVRLDTKLTNIKNSISDAFDETKDYAVGDFCIYDNALQKFTAAKEPGPWDGTKVIPVSIAQEIGQLNGKQDIKFTEWANVNVSANSDTIITTLELDRSKAWVAFGYCSASISDGNATMATSVNPVESGIAKISNSSRTNMNGGGGTVCMGILNYQNQSEGVFHIRLNVYFGAAAEANGYIVALAIPMN